MGIAIVNLALAYRLSKDEKYLTHAKRFMNTVLSYEKWGNAHLVNVDLSHRGFCLGFRLDMIGLSRILAKMKENVLRQS